MSDLIEAEDELNRLRDLLALLSMAAGELPQDESRAMSQGIGIARTVAEDVAQRLVAIRAGSTSGTAA